MSSRAAEALRAPAAAGSAQAGFMLLEVLVALVVAALMLSVIGRALAGGWQATRVPLDVLSAVTLARADLARGPNEPPGMAGMPRGFSVERRLGQASLVARPTDLAPAPLVATPLAGPAGRTPVGNDVMPGVTHHPEAGGGSGQLIRITVTVRTPAGRHLRFETVRLDAAPN